MNNLPHSVVVKQVIIDGNKRIKRSYFQTELLDLVNKPIDTNNLKIYLGEAHRNLNKNGLFESIEIQVVDSIDAIASSQNKLPINIIVRVKENSIPKIKCGTIATSSDIGGELAGVLRSPFGYGETISLEARSSSSGSSEVLFNTNIPHFTKNNYNLDLKAKQTEENNSYFLSYTKKINSISSEMNSNNGKHNLKCEISLRDEIPNQHPLSSYSKDASYHVLNSAISSSKLSTKYSYIHDLRDNIVSPSKGTLIQGSVEVAIPPGTAQYITSEISSQYHYSCGPNMYDKPGLTGSICCNIGTILPLALIFNPFLNKNYYDSNNRKLIPFMSDRYHLGGPSSLRGFDKFGIGSRSHQTSGGNILGDSLGGISKASILATLSVPIPNKSIANQGGRAFMFVNSGSLGDYNFWSKKNINLLNLFGLPRISIGGGLILTMSDNMRIECTYSIPILKSSNDVIKPFQLGLSLTIL